MIQIVVNRSKVRYDMIDKVVKGGGEAGLTGFIRLLSPAQDIANALHPLTSNFAALLCFAL